jgi:two-component system, NarL family, sensor kinase
LAFHPDDQESTYKNFQSFLTVKDNELRETEYRLKDAYGNWHWMKSRKAIFKRDEKGIPIQIIGIAQDITESKKLEEERINLELMQQKEISTAILQTQEEERKRIAEALHNGLGQVLYGAKLTLNTLEPDKNDFKKDNVEIKTMVNTLLDDAIEATRTISFELMPAILQDFGLDTVLRDLLRKTLPKASVKYNLSLSGLKTRMEADVEVAIFRIIQELINNVLKHAHATFADITVNKNSDYISIQFTDNGLGFNTAITSKTKGFGLRSITNRVKLLNGQLNIETGKGKGTNIFIDIPYN